MAKPLRNLALAGVALAGLVGCVSPAELRQADRAECLSYGFQPGTTDLAACLQRESLARRYWLDQQMWGPGYGPWGPGPWGPWRY